RLSSQDIVMQRYSRFSSFAPEITAQAACPAGFLLRALDTSRIEQAAQRFHHARNTADEPANSATHCMTMMPVPGAVGLCRRILRFDTPCERSHALRRRGVGKRG